MTQRNQSGHKPKPGSAARGKSRTSDETRIQRRRRLVRNAAILIVLALIGSFLLGAVMSSPAQAATPAPTQTAAPIVQPTAGGGAPPSDIGSDPIADTDGDGVINNEDPDLDGDGVVNGVDEDIDGDGQPNGDDADPANTNGSLGTGTNSGENTGLPRLIPKEFETPQARGLIAAVILGAGALILVARRKRK